MRTLQGLRRGQRRYRCAQTYLYHQSCRRYILYTVMTPDNIPNPQGTASSLPPVPANSTAPMSIGSSPGRQGKSPNQSSLAANGRYAMRVEQLISQYGNDPYKLSVGLSEVKSAYLTEQFHITPNQAGN